MSKKNNFIFKFFRIYGFIMHYLTTYEKSNILQFLKLKHKKKSFYESSTIKWFVILCAEIIKL